MQPGRLRVLLRARARPDARHAAERSAQRHLLPRGEAVRAGVRAGAEPGQHAGGGSQSGIDDLVAAQKEIVVATWKLDRRARTAKGAKSEQDIKAVARAEAELKTRVEQTSSSFREGAMRDPKRRAPQPQRGGAARAAAAAAAAASRPS